MDQSLRVDESRLRGTLNTAQGVVDRELSECCSLFGVDSNLYHHMLSVSVDFKLSDGNQYNTLTAVEALKNELALETVPCSNVLLKRHCSLKLGTVESTTLDVEEKL